MTAQIHLAFKGATLAKAARFACLPLVFLVSLPTTARVTDGPVSCSIGAFGGAVQSSSSLRTLQLNRPTDQQVEKWAFSGRYSEVLAALTVHPSFELSSRTQLFVAISALASFKPSLAKQQLDALNTSHPQLPVEQLAVFRFMQRIVGSYFGANPPPSQREIEGFAESLLSQPYDPILVLAMNRALKANGQVHIFGAISEALAKFDPHNRPESLGLNILYGSPDNNRIRAQLKKAFAESYRTTLYQLHPLMQSELRFLLLRSNLIEKPVLEMARSLLDRYLRESPNLTQYQLTWLIGFFTDHSQLRPLGELLIESVSSYLKETEGRAQIGDISAALHIQIAEFYLGSEQPNAEEITIGAIHRSLAEEKIRDPSGLIDSHASLDRMIELLQLQKLAEGDTDSALRLGQEFLKGRPVWIPKNRVFELTMQLLSELGEYQTAVALIDSAPLLKQTVDLKQWLRYFTAALANSSSPAKYNRIVSAFEQTDFDSTSVNDLRLIHAIALSQTGRTSKAEQLFLDAERLAAELERGGHVNQVNDRRIAQAVQDSIAKLRFWLRVGQVSKAKFIVDNLLPRLIRSASKNKQIELHAEIERAQFLLRKSN